MPGIKNTEFSVLEFDDFELVCIDNSQGYYTTNQYNLLLEETSKNKPIIIVQHMPIITSCNENSQLKDCGSYYYIEGNTSTNNQKMIDLICNNENIKLILAGHVHGKTETEVVPGKYQLTCSSGLMGNINKITIK